MKRWKHLRDAYIRSEKKDKDSKTSGSEAKKKKKYIFNDELHFLKKVYGVRNTTENFIGAEENVNEDAIINPGPSVNEVSAVTDNSSTQIKINQSGRKRQKKINEIDLKIIKALEKEQPVKTTNPKMSFFESLLPHLDNVTDDQWLQCQMDILKVISKIKHDSHSSHKNNCISNQSTSQCHQKCFPNNERYQQPTNNYNFSQQSCSTPLHSQSPITPSYPSQMKTYQKQTLQSSTLQPNKVVTQQTSSSAAQHYEIFSQSILDDQIHSECSSDHSLSSNYTIDFTLL